MFYQIIRNLREERDLRQKDVAKYLGITTSAYGFYEQNKRKPDHDTIKRLADFYNVSIDFILGQTDISLTPDELATRTIEEALSDDYELLSFFKELKKRDDLKILFKQVRPLPPKMIRRITRLIKVVQDEEDMED